MDELSSDSQRKPGPVVFLRYHSVCLKLRLFANPKATEELTTRVCSSKRLVRGKSQFLSPSTVKYLRLAASWTPSDYLYLVEVLHRHLLNLRTSLRTVLYSQTAWKDGSLSLVKTSNFVSLSCFQLWLFVAFLLTELKYRACSIAWNRE